MEDKQHLRVIYSISVHCPWDLIYRDGYRKWIWENRRKKNVCRADVDILWQSDLATGGNQPNGTKLDGKGCQPVLSQWAFVPFFVVVVVVIAESKVLKLWNTKSQFSLSGGSEPKWRNAKIQNSAVICRRKHAALFT